MSPSTIRAGQSLPRHAEFPILAAEAMLAALASFTVVAPLGLASGLPIIGFAVIGESPWLSRS